MLAQEEVSVFDMVLCSSASISKFKKVLENYLPPEPQLPSFDDEFAFLKDV